MKKPITIAGIDEVHLKSDCIIGSFVIEVREHASFSFALDKPRGQGIYGKTLNEFLYKYKKYICFVSFTFYLEDDDHEPVDFNGVTMNLKAN